MKTFYKKIIAVAVILPFVFGMLCCSICRVAQAKECDSHYTLNLDSHQKPHPCCPINSNSCPRGGISNVLTPEKFEIFTQKNASPFSKIAFLSGEQVKDAYLTSSLKISYQSPPRSIQKSVQIYLFDRVLRL